MKNEHWMRVGV